MPARRHVFYFIQKNWWERFVQSPVILFFSSSLWPGFRRLYCEAIAYIIIDIFLWLGGLHRHSIGLQNSNCLSSFFFLIDSCYETNISFLPSLAALFWSSISCPACQLGYCYALNWASFLVRRTKRERERGRKEASCLTHCAGVTTFCFMHVVREG